MERDRLRGWTLPLWVAHTPARWCTAMEAFLPRGPVSPGCPYITQLRTQAKQLPQGGRQPYFSLSPPALGLHSVIDDVVSLSTSWRALFNKDPSPGGGVLGKRAKLWRCAAKHWQVSLFSNICYLCQLSGIWKLVVLYLTVYSCRLAEAHRPIFSRFYGSSNCLPSFFLEKDFKILTTLFLPFSIYKIHLLV